MPPRIPALSLGDGVAIPQIGFGVYAIPDDRMTETLGVAFEHGYRHVDTASIYRNERSVGRAIAEHDIPRDELFVTTKVWNDAHGRERTLASFEKSLGRLGLDVVDLYLIHWPAAANDLFVETWRTLLELHEEGRVRAVGVSNFRVGDLRRIIDETGVTPSINQIELHPLLQQAELRAFHAAHGIVTEAWSPLALGGELLADPVVVSIASELARTPAQVVLRWHLEIGAVIIPKSVTPSRIAENIDVLGFTLDERQMAAIAGLDRGLRTGMDPDVVA